MSIEEETPVWEGMLDERYECYVIRDTDYTGHLICKDGEHFILNVPVTLSFGAVAGQDADDVSDWMDICEQAVDTRNQKK